MGIIARFANKTFVVSSKKVYTFDDLNFGGDLETETQEVNKKKPSTYNKGPGLETMSLTVQLDQSLNVNVQSEINSWCNIRDSGIAYYFILGSTPIRRCKWLLKSCNIEAHTILRGKILNASLKLSFEEFVRPGTYAASKVGEKSEKTKKAAAKKSKSKNSNAPQRVDINELIGNKSAKTRNNPNASTAIKKGVKR